MHRRTNIPTTMPTSYIYHTALQAIDAGISVIPMRADGSKRPGLPGWREYQQRRATAQELLAWFRYTRPGLACITGAVSGHLEALDFDCPETFACWQQRVQHDDTLGTLWEHLTWGYLEATPSGGRHVLYRCDHIEGNQKLASRQTGDTRTTLIETRGEGGLLIIAPSRGHVHPGGKPYILLRGGLSSIRTITSHQRAMLFAALREFDEAPQNMSRSIPMKRSLPAGSDSIGTRPGDLFNQRATWQEILEPHGWHLVRMVGAEGHWQRPGKKDPGISATTNYHGHDLLYVFSTSTPFEAEKGYSKFHAYTLLTHQGDFSVAARDLAERGYVVHAQEHFSTL